jgi:hypothetical protein
MGVITIVPVEQTFLRVFDKPKKVRLNPQVIEVNYGHLSPFRNGGHLFFQTQESIYVWYLPHPVSKNSIHIPEGYLLYRFFRDRRDAVVLLPRNGAVNAMAISQGELRAQVTFSEGEQKRQLDLFRREYAMADPEVVRLEANARFSAKPGDIMAFAHFDLRPSELLEQGMALAKAPAMAMLLIIAGFTLYQESRLQALVAERKVTLQRLKRENGPMQDALEQVRDQGTFWRDFIAREQGYPDLYRILAQVTGVIERHGGYLNTVEYADNRLTVWTGLKSSEAAIIRDLLATGLFQEVKLLSSGKDASKPNFNLYNLSIVVSPVHGRPA